MTFTTKWQRDGWGLRAQSAEEVLRVIARISLMENRRTYAWRGQNDSSYMFSSSLYRKLAETGPVDEERMREQEMKILRQARKWGLGRDLGPSATDMHLLAILQHHGVDTRLIDVTSNPMTALWFACEEHYPPRESPGVLFAFDVGETEWYESFDHTNQPGRPEDDGRPLSAVYEQALKLSQDNQAPFRIFPALPDERMKAQEGFFLGSAVPPSVAVPDVLGIHLKGRAPGTALLEGLRVERKQGRPSALPFCAIVIPDAVKKKLREPLERTYNRRRRVLFPDVDGFRDAYKRGLG